MDSRLKGGTQKRERHASPVNKADKERERRRSEGSVIQQNMTKLAFFATRSTTAQTVVTDGIPVALADVCFDQFYSHPDTEFCDGRALAAAVAFRSK